MIEHDFDEDFVLSRRSSSDCRICRHPGILRSRHSRIDRLQPAQGVAPVIASRHLELQQGGQQRSFGAAAAGLVRGTAKAVVGVGLLAAAAFMFFEIDVLTSILSAAREPVRFRYRSRRDPNSARWFSDPTPSPSSGRCTRGSPSLSDTPVGLFGGYTAISHRSPDRQTQGSVMKSILLELTRIAAVSAQDAFAQEHDPELRTCSCCRNTRSPTFTDSRVRPGLLSGGLSERTHPARDCRDHE